MSCVKDEPIPELNPGDVAYVDNDPDLFGRVFSYRRVVVKGSKCESGIWYYDVGEDKAIPGYRLYDTVNEMVAAIRSVNRDRKADVLWDTKIQLKALTELLDNWEAFDPDEIKVEEKNA